MPSLNLGRHLKSLSIPGPPSQYAVSAIFDEIRKELPHLSPASEDAVIRCLCLQKPMLVGLATEKLMKLTRSGDIPLQLCEKILFTAMTVAETCTIDVLSAAVVEAFVIEIARSASSWDINTESEVDVRGLDSWNTDWKSHCLSKALLGQPIAGASLLTAVSQLLAERAKCGDLPLLIERLRPFLNLLVFNYADNFDDRLVATMFSGLSRLASALPHGQKKDALLLMSHWIPFLKTNTPLQQSIALQSVAEVMDLFVSLDHSFSR